MFYTRYLFKLKRPEFIPPEKIDEDFYIDIRRRLAEDPKFKFQSDFNFWYYYRNILIAVIIFISSIVFLLLLFYFHAALNPLLVVIPYLFILLGLQPTISFIITMVYYTKYLIHERRYHKDFKKAISDSTRFENFIESFYRGSYSERPKVSEYLFEDDILPIKDYVDAKGLVSDIAVYKFSVPPVFVILSSNEEINKFIESRDGFRKLRKGDKIRWTIKYQAGTPCIYGNKGLKKLMESN
jgi:hypothetical protein